MSTPFLSQTLWNVDKTGKFRFIVPSFEKWVKLIENHDYGEYDEDCLDYIAHDSGNWYAIKMNDSDGKYYFFDNNSFEISFDPLPKFFIDEKLIANNETMDILYEVYFKDVDRNSFQFEKYSRKQVLNIYKMY